MKSISVFHQVNHLKTWSYEDGLVGSHPIYSQEVVGSIPLFVDIIDDWKMENIITQKGRTKFFFKL